MKLNQKKINLCWWIATQIWLFVQMETGKYVLKCNHGVQKGLLCECDNGWMSSGVRESSLLEFHWCDTKMVNKASLIMEPKKLSKGLEIFLATVSFLYIIII